MTAARRPRLLIVTQYCRPEPNFITADVAGAMARHFDVTLITAHPNYPHGRFYEGHRWWSVRRTVENGVTTWRLPIYPYHGRSRLLRAASYLSFTAMAAVFAPIVVSRPDVVWVYQTPFTTGLAVLWFRLTSPARVIFTSADLWPESFIAAGVAKPGLLMRLLLAYRRATNRTADVLICATRGTLDRYAADGIDPSALHFVPVWVEGVGDTTGERPGPGGPMQIVYAGNLGPAQSLDTVVRAAAEIEREGLPVTFGFYGTGSSEPALRDLAAGLGLTSVRFNGRVAPDQAFEVSSRAFAQIVSLQPSPLFSMTIPSKVSFCCAAGAPILYGLPGEAAAMLAESGGGIAFDPSSAPSLVAAVKALLEKSPAERQRMGASLRDYYARHLAKSKLLARYEEIFLDALAARGMKPEEETVRLGGSRAG